MHVGQLTPQICKNEQWEAVVLVFGVFDCTSLRLIFQILKYIPFFPPGRLTSEICRHEEREAVVLVFDVCNFTTLCRREGDVGIATLMHNLFSAFDAAVKTVPGLFKVRMTRYYVYACVATYFLP